MEAFKKFGPWRQVGRGVASSTGNVWKSLGLAGGGGLGCPWAQRQAHSPERGRRPWRGRQPS